MNFNLDTLLLGIVQGATEFLPISSSGHLTLLQTFFNWKPEGLLAFDLILHCATMLAVLIFFRDDIAAFITQWLKGFFSRESRKSEGWSYGWAVLLGSVVTACIALPLKDAAEAAMASRLAVGLGFLATACLMCVAPLFPEKFGGALPHTTQNGLGPLGILFSHRLIKIALAVGAAQGLAVFPGVSRSGATIAAALFMGLGAPEAFRLSFLMSVPAILGASLVEAKAINAAHTLPGGWLFSALAAFLVGYLALLLLRRLVLSGRWAYFGVYCFFLGIFAVVSGVSL